MLRIISYLFIILININGSHRYVQVFGNGYLYQNMEFLQEILENIFFKFLETVSKTVLKKLVPFDLFHDIFLIIAFF